MQRGRRMSESFDEAKWCHSQASVLQYGVGSDFEGWAKKLHKRAGVGKTTFSFILPLHWLIILILYSILRNCYLIFIVPLFWPICHIWEISSQWDNLTLIFHLLIYFTLHKNLQFHPRCSKLQDSVIFKLEYIYLTAFSVIYFLMHICVFIIFWI